MMGCQTHERCEQGRLADSVSTKDAETTSGQNLERHVIDNAGGAIPGTETFDFKTRGGHLRSYLDKLDGLPDGA